VRDELAPFEVVPTVVGWSERRDVYREERLVLTKRALVEIEVGDARRDNLPDRVGRDREAGLLEDLARHCGLGCLTGFDAAAGSQPPRSPLRSRRIAALDEQHRPARDQQCTRGLPFDHHRSDATRRYCGSVSS